MMKSSLKIIVALVAIGAIIVVALAFPDSSASQPMKDSQSLQDVEAKSGGAGGLRPVVDLATAGRSATLSEVMTSTRLGQPAYLPSGSSQPQIRMRDDGSLAVLIYTNPKLPRIDFYEQDVQLVIIAKKDGTSFESFKKVYDKYPKTGYYPTTVTVTDKDGKHQIINTTDYVTVPNRAIVSVAGNPGFVTEPMYTPVHENGRVQWWTSDGIHYIIIANISGQELLKIANSIPHSK